MCIAGLNARCKDILYVFSKMKYQGDSWQKLRKYLNLLQLCIINHRLFFSRIWCICISTLTLVLGMSTMSPTMPGGSASSTTSSAVSGTSTTLLPSSVAGTMLLLCRHPPLLLVYHHHRLPLPPTCQLFLVCHRLSLLQLYWLHHPSSWSINLKLCDIQWLDVVEIIS